MAYATVKSVLTEAGLWNQQIGELLDGVANGTNKVFTTHYKPLVPRTSSASAGTADVAVYVNGVPVTVASLDASTGALTLQNAPTSGATVTADYASSAVSTDDVVQAIAEADDWIDGEMSAVATVPFSGVPATITKISRFYAAGLLMAREYGLEAITEETTKEGGRKLEQAEKWLASYRARLSSNSTDSSDLDLPRSTADQRLFEQYDSSAGTWGPLSDSGVTVRRPS